jgi:hypothetical protein
MKDLISPAQILLFLSSNGIEALSSAGYNSKQGHDHEQW